MRHCSFRSLQIILASLTLVLTTAVATFSQQPQESRCVTFYDKEDGHTSIGDWAINKAYPQAEVIVWSGRLSINGATVSVELDPPAKRLAIQGTSGNTIALTINGERTESNRFANLPALSKTAVARIGFDYWMFIPVEPAGRIESFSIGGVEVRLSAICTYW